MYNNPLCKAYLIQKMFLKLPLSSLHVMLPITRTSFKFDFKINANGWDEPLGISPLNSRSIDTMYV